MKCGIKYFSKKGAEGILKWKSNSRYYKIVKHENHWHIKRRIKARDE